MTSRRFLNLCAAALTTASLALGDAAHAGSGGSVAWGKPTEVISFNPHLSGDGASWSFFHLVYDQLLSTNDDFGLAPGLAESWEEISPTSYRFHLNPGATFSNGRPVTAHDVVANFQRIVDPETGGVWGKQLGEFEAIEAEDDHTVRFDLAAPNAIFLKILPLTTYSILPMQELEAGTFDPAVDILGSGPFMVTEHLQDESWTLARNPHYAREGHPLIDELVIRILPDDSARIAALRDGRVDIATFANPDTPQLLADVPGVEVVVQNTTNYFRLDVSAIEADSPFTDLRVRQAAHYALDREAISNIVFGGQALVDYPVPAGLGYEACRDDPFYVMPREERLAKARALLEEAGATGAKVGVIGSSTLMIYPLIAQVVQASLNEAGFDAFVEQIPAAEWYARVFAEETDFDLAVSWFAGYTDPAIVLFWWTEAGAAGWAHGYTLKDENLDALVAKTRMLPDGAERNAALAEVCSMINENSNVLALVNKPDYVAYRSDLVNARIGRNESTFNNLKYAEEFSRID